MNIGVTCPKCGLLQLAASQCKACGAPLPNSGSALRPPPPAAPFQNPSDAPQAPLESVHHRIRFAGSGWTLLGITIVNWLLTVLTLGVYSFWGKTRTRRYLVGQAEFDGDQFAYHGTGKELLHGWLRALVVFGIPFLLLNFIVKTGYLGLPGRALGGLLLFGAGLFFVAVATVGARRYRLSRTSWREIRFSFRGRAWDFIRLFVGGVLLSIVTLGLYYPFFDVRRQDFLVSHSAFGSEPFIFEGTGRDLFLTYVIGGLLLIPTLGLSWFWISARRQRYFWNHTRLARAQFGCTVTGPGLFWLSLVNAVVIVFTLAFGWPWTRLRSLRYFVSHLILTGPLDFDAIRQDADTATALGDALAGFLDVGFDLG
jgi:uncharacterized membrane protein YjgN (DUF898 family)